MYTDHVPPLGRGIGRIGVPPLGGAMTVIDVHVIMRQRFFLRHVWLTAQGGSVDRCLTLYRINNPSALQ